MTFNYIQVNYSGKGAQCNRAIMIVTDGAPENYVDIFSKYNWPDKNVSTFTKKLKYNCNDFCHATMCTVVKNECNYIQNHKYCFKRSELV